jgi:DeoR/GlpR family transcriptional regulator of sugar metabolism
VARNGSRTSTHAAPMLRRRRTATRLRKPERQARILAELATTPTIRISTLAGKFAVSDETVRRDLDELGADGLLNRTYGGASISPLGVEPSLNERYHILVHERTRIARCAVELVSPGEVLMIDAGSTTAHFARCIAAELSELTVVTNSLAAATALAASPGIRVIMAPGDYQAREGGVFGPETNGFLSRFVADQCIIGASGLTTAGPTEANSGSAWVKRAMLAQSRRHVLLIDRSKYDQPRLEVVCPLSALDDIVADQAPSRALAKHLAKASVRLHLAK